MSTLPKFSKSAASEYAPPTERPVCDLTLAQAIDTIPFEKFNFNPQFADKDPYILISSGSFSPITILHVQLLTMVRDYIMVEKQAGHVLGALLSPVHDAYGKPSLIDQNHRIKMCQLATEDIPWIGVSTVETAQSKWVETRLIFDLLRMSITHVFKQVSVELSSNSQHSQSISTQLKVTPRLVFCMGSDVFLGFREQSWWSHEDVKEYCTTYRLAVLLREEDAEKVETLLTTHPVLSRHRDSIWIIPPTYQNTISSTLIRKQLAKGGSIHGLVHPKVEEYIITNNLYRPTGPSAAPLTKPDASEQNYIRLFSTKPTFDTPPIVIATECPIPLDLFQDQ